MFSLEVHLSKTESSYWPNLVPGDTRGTRTFTAEQLSEISDRLENFTSYEVYVCFIKLKFNIYCVNSLLCSSNAVQ